MSDYDFHPIVYDYDDFTPAELEAMRASLKQVGLLQPIVIWKNQIVDGKHRETLCREERVNRTYKDITARCPTEEEMREYVRALNQHRRSRTTPLTAEEKRAKAAAAIKADPKLADNAISEQLGDVSQPTVHRVRKELEEKRVIPRITPTERKSRTGKVGEGARKTTAAPASKLTTKPKSTTKPKTPEGMSISGKPLPAAEVEEINNFLQTHTPCGIPIDADEPVVTAPPTAPAQPGHPGPEPGPAQPEQPGPAAPLPSLDEMMRVMMLEPERPCDKAAMDWMNRRAAMALDILVRAQDRLCPPCINCLRQTSSMQRRTSTV